MQYRQSLARRPVAAVWLCRLGLGAADAICVIRVRKMCLGTGVSKPVGCTIAHFND